MSKQENLVLVGDVVEELGNSMFRVELNDSDYQVLCTISGKIRKNYIRILPGDRVRIEVSPYDLTRGRIITRLSLTTNEDNKSSNNKKSNNKKSKKND